MHITNVKKLEIDITHVCTLQCFNCDRGLSLMPGGKETNVSLEQINKLIKQTIDNNHHWEQIRIMGGEATVHPEFNKIIQTLYDYKQKYNRSLRLIVATNGHTEFTKNKLNWLELNYPSIIVENTAKVNNYQKGFDLIHYAASDFNDDPNYQYKGCWTTEACGVGLNASGFYCCAVGGAIDKFFKYDIGIKDLTEVTIENMTKMFEPLCSKCGRHEHIQVDNNNIEVVVSKTWKECLDNFDADKKLARY
ncbi:radical SAM protein [Paenibacillus amylolyticus]|uniref:radical SAM protein n=1 Tax=Paenibacillus amylolyticus TaxID=1451 RepID=UPI003242E5CB